MGLNEIKGEHPPQNLIEIETAESEVEVYGHVVVLNVAKRLAFELAANWIPETQVFPSLRMNISRSQLN